MNFSLKKLAFDCLSLSPPFSVVHDVFAYESLPKKTISVKQQFEYMLYDCYCFFSPKARFGIEGIRYFDNVNASGIFGAKKAVDLPYAFNICGGLDEKLRKAGHKRIFYWGGDDCWEIEMRSHLKDGIDEQCADNVDLFFIHTHCRNDNGKPQLLYNVEHDKWISGSEDWHFGDKNLEWLMIFGCNSIDLNKVGQLWNIFRRLHMFCGNYDLTYEGWTVDEIGDDLGEDLTDGDSVCRAWIDAVADWWLDEHPAIIAAERRDVCKEDGSIDWPNTTMNQDHLLGHGTTVQDISPKDICALTLIYSVG
jgi:hypothetical protein